MINNQVNCASCMSKYENNRTYRGHKGCFGVKERVLAQFNLKYYGMSLNYKTCPGRIRVPSYSILFDLEDKYQRGFLPFDGAISDQPAKIVEALDFVITLKREQQEQAQKEAENQRKHL